MREVLEETGVQTKFEALVCFRHWHGYRYGKSDIYFVCRLSPLSEEVTMQAEELEECLWMPVADYFGSELVSVFNKRIVRAALASPGVTHRVDRGLRRPEQVRVLHAARCAVTLALPIQPPIAPMLAELARELPTGEGWLYEPKWDGFRAIVFWDGQELLIQSRDLKPLGRYFPELEAGLRAGAASAVRARRRSGHRRRKGAGLRGARPADPSGGSRASRCWRARRRPSLSRSTCWRQATRT